LILKQHKLRFQNSIFDILLFVIASKTGFHRGTWRKEMRLSLPNLPTLRKISAESRIMPRTIEQAASNASFDSNFKTENDFKARCCRNEEVKQACDREGRKVFQPPLPSHPIRGFVDKQFTTVLHIIGLI
jgi:hypothetical protein